MNTQELTAFLKQLNEYPSELLQSTDADLYALEMALYDLAEHLQQIREGNKV